MLALCQPESRVIRAFADVEKPFLFSDFVKAAKSENEKVFVTSEKAGICSILSRRWVNSHFDTVNARHSAR